MDNEQHYSLNVNGCIKNEMDGICRMHNSDTKCWKRF
jgi:hypothetical protein